MSSTDPTTETLQVPGTLSEYTTRTVRLAPLYGALATLADLLPSVDYNAQGKRLRTAQHEDRQQLVVEDRKNKSPFPENPRRLLSFYPSVLSLASLPDSLKPGLNSALLD